MNVDDIDLESARALVRRAVDRCEQLGLSGAVVVVGASGALITGSRMDDGGAGAMGRARSKAWIAATQRVPSAEHLRRLGVIDPAVALGFPAISPEAAFPEAGGLPVRRDGRIVAGIAVSGATLSSSSEDLVIAHALDQEDVAAAPAPSEQADLDWYRGLADAVHDRARAAGLPVAVSVVDRRGEPVQHDAMDDAPVGGAYVAEAVAAASALFHAPSGDLADRLAVSAHVLPVTVSSLSGGIPVVREGRVVGGLGVGGPAPFRCHEVAVAALAAYA